MDIDEFLDKETAKLGGKAQIDEKQSGGGGKRQDSNMLEHLEVVRSQLRENDFGSALKEFDFLKSRYTDMTKKQLSENRFVFNELLRINNEIINKIQNNRAEFQKKVGMLQKLLQDARTRLQSGDLDGAHKLDIEMNEILKQMPDIFYEEKNDMKYQVMAFSAQLFPKIQERNKQNFEQKKQELKNQINKTYQQVRQNSGQLSQQAYNQINNMFISLPQGHIYEKALLYNDILKLFRTSSLIGETNEVLKQVVQQQGNIYSQAMGSRPQNTGEAQHTSGSQAGSQPQNTGQATPGSQAQATQQGTSTDKAQQSTSSHGTPSAPAQSSSPTSSSAPSPTSSSAPSPTSSSAPSPTSSSASSSQPPRPPATSDKQGSQMPKGNMQQSSGSSGQTGSKPSSPAMPSMDKSGKDKKNKGGFFSRLFGKKEKKKGNKEESAQKPKMESPPAPKKDEGESGKNKSTKDYDFSLK